MSAPRPYEQLRFEDLPERPRVAHPFFDAPRERVTVRSAHFGSIGIAVRRMGSGPPLLCVHGLMTSSYSFRYVLAPLARRFEVFVPDLPGAGQSDAPDVAYAPVALAELIGDLMIALGIEGAPVIGNSMGGYLGLWLALRRPRAMSRLVDLHSPGVATARMWALEGALGSVPGSGRVLDLLVRRDPLRWAHRNVHYYDETLKSLEEAREYGAPLATEAGRRAFEHYLRDTLRASDMRALARELARTTFPIPLLLVYARRDPMVPPSVGPALARAIPGAELRWLERGSHFAHVDAPELFLETALPFLAQDPNA